MRAAELYRQQWLIRKEPGWTTDLSCHNIQMFPSVHHKSQDDFALPLQDLDIRLLELSDPNHH